MARYTAHGMCCRPRRRLMGYSAGLLGLVAIKVLTPGYFAEQEYPHPGPHSSRLVVLFITQGFNALLVPWLSRVGLAHAGPGTCPSASVPWSMRCGCWLVCCVASTYGSGARLGPLCAAGALRPAPLLAVFLMWVSSAPYPGLRMGEDKLKRVGATSPRRSLPAAAIYFVAVWVAGLNLRQFLRR
jgi:putative peptidoglycan lipid II flippase